MQKKKGISLIVLIITIIVMLILAGTVIISLSNNGIIDKAKDAVDKTNESQVQELVNLAWAEAYANNMGLPKEELQVKLQEGVEKALSDNNLDKEDYGMQVTTTGVTIVKGWLQTENGKIIKGSTVLEIGDKLSYNPKAGLSEAEIARYTYTSTKAKNGEEDVTYNLSNMYDGDWYVIGANDNRELLILSSGTVGNIAFYGWAGFNNGVGELDTICSLVGHGKKAVSARSIKKEDIENLVGSFGDDTYFAYDSSALEEWAEPNIIVSQNIFNVITLKKYGSYYISNIFDQTNSKGILRMEECSTDRARFMEDFEDNCICNNSDDDIYEAIQYSRGIRAVVTLSNDTNLSGSSASGWNIQ